MLWHHGRCVGTEPTHLFWCSGLQDCEHQWLCWLCQHYWFVVVVIWVIVGLGGVSLPFEPKPMVENNSGALWCKSCAYTHEYLFVHLVHNSSSVALQLHSSASQPSGGSAICVDNTQKAVEWQVWLMRHLVRSGDLLSVPSGGCML